jgi:hypothetical protein
MLLAMRLMLAAVPLRSQHDGSGPGEKALPHVEHGNDEDEGKQGAEQESEQFLLRFHRFTLQGLA